MRIEVLAHLVAELLGVDGSLDEVTVRTVRARVHAVLDGEPLDPGKDWLCRQTDYGQDDVVCTIAARLRKTGGMSAWSALGHGRTKTSIVLLEHGASDS